MVDDRYDSNNDFENNDFDSFRSTAIVNGGKGDGNGGTKAANRRRTEMGRQLGNDDKINTYPIAVNTNLIYHLFPSSTYSIHHPSR